MQREPYPPRDAWRAVAVLTLAYVFSFIDRQILTLLVQPIERDLAISDTQMSVLMGASFAIFYTLFGIPLGRLADSRSRRALIGWGMALWSVMTVGCGLAQTYPQLLACRIGVGVGEAALSPAAYSLLADAFPKEKRATAISVYSMGIYLGAGLAFVLGGVVLDLAAKQSHVSVPLAGDTRPWQVVFFVVGGAGLVLAPLLLAVREPPRGAAASAPPFRDVLAVLRANRVTVVTHNAGIALIALSGYAITAWVPTLFQRRFEWSATRAGVTFGAIFGVFGMLGIVAGGRLADRLAARGRRDANLRVAWLGAAACAPLGAAFPLIPSAAWAAAALAPLCFFVSMPFGVAPAAIQEAMPPAMRAQASAVYLFVLNLVGYGLGPSAVALLTDRVFGDPRAVHLSLLVVVVSGAIASAALLAIGSAPYVRTLDAMSGVVGPRVLKQPRHEGA